VSGFIRAWLMESIMGIRFTRGLGLVGLVVFVVCLGAVPQIAAGQDDEESLLDRPSFAEQIQSQLDGETDQLVPASQEEPTEQGEPQSAGASPVVPADLPIAESVASPKPLPAPAPPPASEPSPEELGGPVVEATPSEPAAPVVSIDDVENRNTVALVVFVLVVVILVVVLVLVAVFSAGINRKRLRRKHQHAVVHAHDEHPVGQPDDDADALGSLAQAHDGR